VNKLVTLRPSSRLIRPDVRRTFEWVSMGLQLLRLSAKILALVRYRLIFFSYGKKKEKINFFCLKELNVNKTLFLSLKQYKHLGIISGCIQRKCTVFLSPGTKQSVLNKELSVLSIV